jgi:hypothetical protein
MESERTIVGNIGFLASPGGLRMTDELGLPQPGAAVDHDREATDDVSAPQAEIAVGGDFPGAPVALLPYLQRNAVGDTILTGIPDGWTVKIRTEYEDGPRRRGVALIWAWWAGFSAGAVVAATMAWGRLGLFGTLAVCIGVCVSLGMRLPKGKAIKRQLIFELPPEPVWQVGVAGKRIAGADATCELIYEMDPTSTPESTAPPLWVFRLAGGLVILFGLVTLGRASGLETAEFHDRLLAIIIGLGSFLGAGLLLWQWRRWAATVPNPNKIAVRQPGVRPGGARWCAAR